MSLKSPSFLGTSPKGEILRDGNGGYSNGPLPSGAGVLYVFCAPLYWGLL